MFRLPAAIAFGALLLSPTSCAQTAPPTSSSAVTAVSASSPLGIASADDFTVVGDRLVWAERHGDRTADIVSAALTGGPPTSAQTLTVPSGHELGAIAMAGSSNGTLAVLEEDDHGDRVVSKHVLRGPLGSTPLADLGTLPRNNDTSYTAPSLPPLTAVDGGVVAFTPVPGKPNQRQAVFYPDGSPSGHVVALPSAPLPGTLAAGGHFLAFETHQHTWVVVDLTSGQTVRTLRDTDQFVAAAAVGADGSLAIAEGDELMWSPAASRALQPVDYDPDFDDGVDGTPSFSLDGNRVAVRHRADDGVTIDVLELKSAPSGKTITPEREYRTKASESGLYFFHLSGSHLAWATDTCHLAADVTTAPSGAPVPPGGPCVQTEASAEFDSGGGAHIEGSARRPVLPVEVHCTFAPGAACHLEVRLRLNLPKADIGAIGPLKATVAVGKTKTFKVPVSRLQARRVAKADKAADYFGEGDETTSLEASTETYAIEGGRTTLVNID